eukprot:CAMPEP_0117079358 /NCGR_PEP_ID=MMETSP0472-20121206/55991_1 /TAXON_ID=693140 ORGANISM="Tiarina fusus, Strain LIS" /NCGR_SAMPLE_ID=MMETSP0472 /ASSEMBLY_ACC=CAM_ASM_000603 /LENGTH=139 /DNA_ID=CAMNT_0004806553 /DNA_START=544 /DNA_END=960 /DNA_ORIENTATION=-
MKSELKHNAELYISQNSGTKSGPVTTRIYVNGNNIQLYLMSKARGIKKDSKKRMKESDEQMIYDRLKFSEWYDCNPLFCCFDSQVELNIEQSLNDKFFIFQVKSIVLVISCENLILFLQKCGSREPQWIAPKILFTPKQ